jgi:transposase
MKYVGVDLHKQSITVCVMVKEGDQRKIVQRRTLRCADTEAIRKFFEQLGRPFRLVVEATSSYEWFLLLVEDLADRCVLAHPKKLRVIAESKQKSDKIDARILAEFLLLDMIPEAHRPTPRIRQYRVLVRHRDRIQRQITSVKSKLRHKAAFYNADVAELFTARGLEHLAKIAMSHADQFECHALREQLLFLQKQLLAANKELASFAQSAPVAERESRAVLATMPTVGTVTVDVVLSETADVRRFRSAKKIVAFAGLDPGFRESAGKSKELHITKEGSRLLRWALIETAWRLVRKSARWRRLFMMLMVTTGHKKKAIVGVARRVLCVMYAMLRDGKAYRPEAI